MADGLRKLIRKRFLNSLLKIGSKPRRIPA